MTLQWTPNLSVGDPLLDADHKKLINIINELEMTIAAQNGVVDLRVFLQRICVFTETHFAREEEQFARTKYPDAEKHIKNHRDFEKLMHDLLAAYEQNPKSLLPLNLLNVLREWHNKHTKEMDRGYAFYIKNARKAQW